MILLMQCVNEEKSVERVLKDIHDETFIERVIVIDGGSTDYTREILLGFPKVEVYVHPWVDWYHDMQAMQRNVGLSYIPHGEVCFILDFDEKCSPELKVALEEIEEDGLPNGADVVCFSRKTFELMRHEDSPFAILDDENWPVPSHQIGQYPDYQLRLIRRKPGMFWMNSPHHVLFGIQDKLFKEVFLDMDILHYDGKDDARDRLAIERKWARAQARRIELGLTPDAFEVKLKPEFVSFGDPEMWKKTTPDGKGGL